MVKSPFNHVISPLTKPQVASRHCTIRRHMHRECWLLQKKKLPTVHLIHNVIAGHKTNWTKKITNCPSNSKQNELPTVHLCRKDPRQLSWEIGHHCLQVQTRQIPNKIVKKKIWVRLVLWDCLSGLVTFTRCCCRYERALSFTLCILCTIMISCSLTPKERIKLYRASAFSFGKQDWLKGEFQIKVLNLIPKQMENRLGT